MKKILLTMLTIGLSMASLTAQGIAINETGNNPDPSAMLDVESTDKGFLPPRMTTNQRDAINGGNPSEGLIIYNTDVRCLQWYVGNGIWHDGCGNTSIPPTPVFCNNPTEIVEVTGAAGRIWMDRNLGASQAATAYNDALSYGDLYQWGRFTDGHQCRDSDNHDGSTQGFATTAVPLDGNAWDGKFIYQNFVGGVSPDWLSPSNANLWQGVTGVNNPCPSGFRLPTNAEWIAERDSWTSQDRAGAFASPLKLPVGGNKSATNDTGYIFNENEKAFYWSSSTFSGGTSGAIEISSSSATVFENRDRGTGYAVRCIKQ